MCAREEERHTQDLKFIHVKILHLLRETTQANILSVQKDTTFNNNIVNMEFRRSIEETE